MVRLKWIDGKLVEVCPVCNPVIPVPGTDWSHAGTSAVSQPQRCPQCARGTVLHGAEVVAR